MNTAQPVANHESDQGDSVTPPLFDMCRCPDCGVLHYPATPNLGILSDRVLSDLCPECQEKRKGGIR